MWPLLAELGVALLKQDSDNRELREQRRHALAQGQIDIMNQRAARAGDPGYMRHALGAAQSFPHNPDNGTGMLLGVAGGLLKQNGASDAEDAAAAAGGDQTRDLDNEIAPTFGSHRKDTYGGFW